MQTENEPYTLQAQGWTVRVRRPLQPASPRTMLLIHGKTGNETVMWIFTQKLPPNYWLFAPRAPIELEAGSFSWLDETEHLPKLNDFQKPGQALLNAFERWRAETGAPVQPVDVMGFSQGAALAYALAAFFPQQIANVIALAGFLPSTDTFPGPYAALRHKRVFIAHGSRDETVPISNARFAVDTLKKVGADVTYCESDAGHKLSANCLRGLSSFIQNDTE